MHLEPNFERRIEQLFEQNDWVTDDLDAQFELAASRINEGRLPPHSLHFTAESTSGSLLHIRVLIWRSMAWRKRRAVCIEHHRHLATVTASTHRAFHVPRMLASGTSPLVWDATEHVDGIALPWLLDKNQGLSHELDTIPKFVDVAVDLAALSAPRVPRRNLHALAPELRSMAMWAKRAGIINSHEQHQMMKEVRRFDKWVRPHVTPQLAHGDFNPGNLLLHGNLKPWLIDFDDLRLSIPGDSLGRLFAITYSERRFSRAVMKEVRAGFDDGNYECFRIMAYWHLFNFWRQMLNESGTKATTLTHLDADIRWAAYHIDKSRWTLEVLLGSQP